MDSKKRARAGDTADAPRKPPRLEWPAAATAAALHASDPWEKAAALTSDSSIHLCQHVLCEELHIGDLIVLIITSIDGPMCDAYKCGTTEGRNILVCLDCRSSFCTGHAKRHALIAQHWVALMYKRPNVAYCFACEDSYFIQSEEILEIMMAVKDDLYMGTHKKDEKGMTVDNEAGGHASAVREADYGGAPMAALTSDVGAPRCEHYMYNNDQIGWVQRGIMFCDIAKICSDCDNVWGYTIYVCLGCEKPFCTVHANIHANSTKHLIALAYHSPYLACCFLCNKTFVLGVEVDKEGMLVDNGTGGRASGSVIGHAHAIKGILNLGNTCYLNSLVQCLLVLGKLRARMLGPDAPSGTLGTVLHDLFEQTYSVNNARGLLDTSLFLRCVRILDSRFEGAFMQDNHELLCCLRNRLDEEERMRKPPNMQDSAASAAPPTVIHSIFGGQLSVTISCKCCLFRSVSHDVFYDLSVPLPPKKPPAKSVESPPWTKGHRSQQKIHINQLEAIQKRNTEKTHTIAEDGDSENPSSELEDVVMVKTSEPLEVDSTEGEQISQSKYAVQDPLQTQMDNVQGKAVDFLSQNVLSDVKIERMDVTMDSHIPEDIGPPPPVSLLREENAQIESGSDGGKNDSVVPDDEFGEPEVSSEPKADTFSTEVTTEDKGKIQSSNIVCEKAQGINSLTSIDECLELHFEAEMIEWTCENCSKVAQKPGIIQGAYSEPMFSSTNEDTTVDGDQREQSEKVACQSEQSNKKPECPDGVQEAVPSCVPAEKQDNLLSSQDQNATILDEGRGKQVKFHCSAHQVEESQNEQKDRNKDGIKTHLISKLPPVLVIHLKRSLGPDKVIGHVRFKDILDVGLFMDPSSEDKDNSSYRLVGVVEHQGLGTDIGHFVAYVRPSPLQPTNGSSSWFRASDDNIKKISLEEVLECEAYLLFYERMED